MTTLRKALLILSLALLFALLSASGVAAENTVRVGDTITYGSCPQTMSGKDSTPIKWTVLEVYDDGSVLAISNKVLFFHTWSDRFSNVMGNSTVASTDVSDSQGTNSMLDPGFSPSDRASYEDWKSQDHYAEAEMTLSGEDLSLYSGYQIILPTMDDADKYNLGKCAPTDYAEASGVEFYNGTCSYWLDFGKDHFDDSWTGQYNQTHWHIQGPIVSTSGDAMVWSPTAVAGYGASAKVGFRPMIKLFHMSMTLSLWSDGDKDEKTVHGINFAESTDGKSVIDTGLEYCDGNLLAPDPAEDDEFFLRICGKNFTGETTVTLKLPKGFSFDRYQVKEEQDVLLRGSGSEDAVEVIPVYSVYQTHSENRFTVTVLATSGNSEFPLRIQCTSCERSIIIPHKTLLFIPNDIREKADTDWSQLFGNGVSTRYEQSLANLSCFLSFSVYDEDSIKQSLHSIGFHSFQWNNTGGTKYGADCCFAAKTLVGSSGRIMRLIAIVIRGTSNKQEFLGNLMVGEAENPTTFLSSSNTIYALFKDYLNNLTKKYEANKDSIIFYSCGHSRGGAVSNLLTHNAIQDGFPSVGYTFAPPNTVLESSASSSDNIYNIKYAFDVVSYVPQVYINHGQTYVVGLKTTPSAVTQKYLSLTMKTWTMPRTQTLIHTIVGTRGAGNRLATDHPYATSFIMSGVSIVFDNAGIPSILKAHSAENYISWMTGAGITDTSTYSEALKAFGAFRSSIIAVKAAGNKTKQIYATTVEQLEEALGKFSNGRRSKLLAVSCPVEITLCTPDGQVAAWTKNHQLQFYKEDAVFAICDGETDYFVFPADAGYELEITGNGSGTMDICTCTVDESLQAGAISAFENVPITDTEYYRLDPGASGAKPTLFTSDDQEYGEAVAAVDRWLALPANLKSLPDNAFAGDKTLNGGIECPEGLTSIGSYVFKGTKITRVQLPKSVTAIAEDAFSGMDANVRFECYAGTYAEKWLKKHGFTYTLRG